MFSVNIYSFPPFLPEDNDVIGSNNSAESLDLFRAEVGRLLGESPQAFWQIVSTTPALVSSLDSYLQYARRAHDEAADGDELSLDLQELAKNVFLAFLRMVTCEPDSIKVAVQATMLYDLWLLDMPKLMDLSVLYGQHSPELVSRFMEQAFDMQPQYGRDLAETAPRLADNVQAVCETCHRAAEELKANSSSVSMNGLADGMAYLHDTCRTLAAFVRSYPPAGVPLAGMASSSLMTLLPPLHDELLPLVAAAAVAQHQAVGPPGFSSGHTASLLGQVQHHLSGLAECLPSLAYLLIVHGLLEVPSATSTHAHSSSARSPTQRGQRLMTALTSVELPSGGGGSTQASLLHVTAQQFHLADVIRQSLVEGTIALDDVQQEYLFVQLGQRAAHSVSSAVAASQPGSSRASGMAPEQQQRDINRILEVLPEYGRGFLAACLDSTNHDPEAVIHQLLEGSLPKHLSKMDPHLTSWQPQPSPHNRRPAAAPLPPGRNMSWNNVLDEHEVAGPSAAPPSMKPGAPKPAAHKGTARALALPAADRAAVHAHASAAQWDEWDDDYDDSFDDLGVVNLDGTADVEGNDEDTWPARSRGGADRQQGLAASSSRSASQPSQPDRTRKRTSRLWVLDGRIYNYAKEDATEVSGPAQAQDLVQAAQAMTQQIHGLGPGGNVPVQQEQPSGAAHGQASSTAPSPMQQDSGRGGATKDNRAHAHKDKHKAAIANHHRKDRAMRKMAGPPT